MLLQRSCSSPYAALENLGLGHQPWKALRVIVEENRAEINFELVARLQEREQSDWTYFGRLRQKREKKYRDPQDVLIEADPSAAADEEASNAATRNSATIAPARCMPSQLRDRFSVEVPNRCANVGPN
jgi:hypothetical protein